MTGMRNKTLIKALVFAVFCGFFSPVAAQDDSENAFRATSYPLPRFVSLASDEIYVRTGPGQKYPIKFIYKKKGLPVEVILEYEVWRKIRDREGEVGWVHKSLLSGKRTGLIQSGDMVSAYRKPKLDARLVAYLEPQTMGDLEECEREWCEFSAAGYRGWVQKKFIWGAYDAEEFD